MDTGEKLLFGLMEMDTNNEDVQTNYETTKTLSSPLSPLVMRVSASTNVTSNSPLPVLEGGLKASGIRGTSKGGSCDKFPSAFTVVFSNVILIFAGPVYIHTHQKEKAFHQHVTRKITIKSI